MTETNTPQRILVTGVIEKDQDRVLLAGTRRGRRVTFHLRHDAEGKTAELVKELEAGSQVWVDLP